MAIKISGTTVIHDDKVFQVGSGTTAQRPGTPQTGMVRYNTTLAAFEGYSSQWGAIGGGDLNGSPLLNIGAFSTKVTDLGSVSSSVSINVSTSSKYRLTATGAISTWTITGWPASGAEGIVQITLANGSNLAATNLNGVANWLVGDGFTSTTFSDTNVILSNINYITLWTINGGTTVYGVVV